MLTISDLPAINASLNTTSAVFLCLGFYFIRRKHIAAHRVCMISAFAVSAIFLVCYLTYHSQHLTKKFTGTGFIRWVYFTVLISHSILATVVVPLVLVTLYRAIRGQFEKHKPLARWTWPIWLYVSVTGVVVYWMLYHLNP